MNNVFPYMDLFPELKPIVRDACTHSTRLLLRMTCHAEHAVPPPRFAPGAHFDAILPRDMMFETLTMAWEQRQTLARRKAVDLLDVLAYDGEWRLMEILMRARGDDAIDQHQLLHLALMRNHAHVARMLLSRINDWTVAPRNVSVPCQICISYAVASKDESSDLYLIFTLMDLYHRRTHSFVPMTRAFDDDMDASEFWRCAADGNEPIDYMEIQSLTTVAILTNNTALLMWFIFMDRLTLLHFRAIVRYYIGGQRVLFHIPWPIENTIAAMRTVRRHYRLPSGMWLRRHGNALRTLVIAAFITRGATVAEIDAVLTTNGDLWQPITTLQFARVKFNVGHIIISLFERAVAVENMDVVRFFAQEVIQEVIRNGDRLNRRRIIDVYSTWLKPGRGRRVHGPDVTISPAMVVELLATPDIRTLIDFPPDNGDMDRARHYGYVQ